MRELTMSALPSQSCWTVVLIDLAAYHSFHDANFFNLNMHISNPWGPTRWSVSFLGCGVWATSRFGYLALCFKRGCETILNVMVPGWSQIVFGCVWLCHCYLNLRCLSTEIDEFLGPRISHNLACFRCCGSFWFQCILRRMESWKIWFALHFVMCSLKILISGTSASSIRTRTRKINCENSLRQPLWSSIFLAKLNELGILGCLTKVGWA